MYETSSAFNYSVIITSLYILGGMTFIGGLKQEYTLSLTFITSMILYDLLTNDLPTILFAGVSFIALIIGSFSSIIVSKFMEPSDNIKENNDSVNQNQVAPIIY
ncbi:hypothetical protein E4H04_10975 [Candidatus Bathyarchaeota archaeon]|nr:MAG: hypothetical protein E4H04_10975 [Candidatus Bathyarchaeota archaeon]